MAERYVYLDYAASAPLRRVSIEAEQGYLSQRFSAANPNSLHGLGREAARMLESARASLVRVLGGGFRPQELVFCSGGTEANNLAVLGMAEGARVRNSKRKRVLISAIEHDSILELAPPLKERGFEVELVPPSRLGVIDSESLHERMADDVCLVSCMAANNETGAVQPISKLAELAHEHGALFHTDAVQAFLRVPLDFSHCDAVTITAHKIGGPVGIGAFALRSRCPFKTQSFGGGQESGKRSGTQDVSGAVAFAAVADALSGNIAERADITAELADYLVSRLVYPDSAIKLTIPEDSGVERLPGTVHLLIYGADSESLILHLDNAGFCVSAGSACSSGSLDPSHVLLAMGIGRDEAYGALRVSFDERVSREDLAAFCDCLLELLDTHTS